MTRLKAAGVTLFGKTNVPLMLADWQSYNAIYGTTNNPWDLARSPGGSSGGSAAALAAGLTGIEAGSDIGASIRNPAHYCGVYGHKPTWGVVSPRGHALPGRVAQGDISVIGPLARGADDLEIALDAMAGPDDVDGAGWVLRLPKPAKRTLREFRVAIMYDDPNSAVDSEVKTLLHRLAAFPRPRQGQAERQGPAGHRHVRAARALRQAAALGDVRPAVRRRLRGRAGAGAPPRAGRRELLRPHDPRQRAQPPRLAGRQRAPPSAAAGIRRVLPRLRPAAVPGRGLRRLPARPGRRAPRPPIEVDGRRVPTTDQLFWAGLNGVVSLPGTVAPIGLTPSGLPVGVQIIGPQYADRTCIHFARLLEREYHAFEPPPAYAA